MANPFFSRRQMLGVKHLSSPQTAATALLALMCTLIYFPSGEALLRGTDAAVYCEVARETASRPAWQWAETTLDGAPFFEHPPLMMLGLAWVFNTFGATTRTALWAAHLWMTAVVALSAAIALQIAGTMAAVGTLVALCLQSGLWHEAQNPMLELPTTLCLLLGLYGLVLAPRSKARRALAFVCAAVGPAAALLTKGPVGFLCVPVALFAAYVGLCSWRRTVGVLTAAFAITALCLGIFECMRSRVGAPPFLSQYLKLQLWPSMAQGRHNAQPSYLYYAPVLVRWYGAGTALVPVAAAATWVAARRRKPEVARLLGMAFVWLVVTLLAFSCMQQKYQWYLHIALPAFGWLGGTVAAALPQVVRPLVCRALTCAAFLALCSFLGLKFWAPHTLAPTAAPCLSALHALALESSPDRPPPKTVACCVPKAPWRDHYVALFVLGARLVPCGEAADITVGPAGLLRGQKNTRTP